jgi:nucleoside-diphosphate kinase
LPASSFALQDPTTWLGKRVTSSHAFEQEDEMADTQRTFIMVKPDGVRRRLVGEVIRRIEAKGYGLREMKLFTIDRTLAETHYGEHKEKPFFGELVDFITSGPVVAMVVEGDDAVAGMRQIMGATNPLDSAPGSIRGDFASVITENIVHGSDSPESAEREIGLFFGS